MNEQPAKQEDGNHLHGAKSILISRKHKSRKNFSNGSIENCCYYFLERSFHLYPALNLVNPLSNISKNLHPPECAEIYVVLSLEIKF